MNIRNEKNHEMIEFRKLHSESTCQTYAKRVQCIITQVRLIKSNTIIIPILEMRSLRYRTQ